MENRKTRRVIKKAARKAGFPVVPNLLRDRVAEAPAEYLKRLDMFCSVLAECMEISRRFGGYKSSTAQHYWASNLFTALCTRGASLAFVAPYSKWAVRQFEHWDYASTANVARSILETRLNFYYLCIEQCSADEWNCRWNTLNLHDCTARIDLMESSLSQGSDLSQLKVTADELRERLKANKHFESLEPGMQKSILNGRKAHLASLEDISVSAGLEISQFRWLWKLLSSHAHALPLSFYRIGDGEDGRGRGVQTRIEENYTTMLLSLCTSLLVKSRDEYLKLMDGIENMSKKES